jgi:hypothetical protein
LKPWARTARCYASWRKIYYYASNNPLFFILKSDKLHSKNTGFQGSLNK